MELAAEAALSDARLAEQQHDAEVPLECTAQLAFERAELLSPPGELRDRAWRGPPLPARGADRSAHHSVSRFGVRKRRGPGPPVLVDLARGTTQAVEIDDRARVQLGDDVFVLEDELNAVKELLLGATDWDAELERLLNGEIPPHGADTDPEEDG